MPASADALALTDAGGNVRPLEEIEAEVIRFAIARYRGQMSEVARRLRIGRSTLYRKLDEIGLGGAGRVRPTKPWRPGDRWGELRPCDEPDALSAVDFVRSLESFRC